MRRTVLLTVTVLGSALAATAGCGRTTNTAGQAPAGVPAASASTASGVAGAGPGPATQPGRTTAAPPPAWPSPEDCVAYRPASLTVHYEAGIYAVTDGATIVLRAPGGPGESIGSKALALAQHFRRHCFLGRGNSREDHNAYVFDYWRDPSGLTPTIADQDEDCSGYDPANLTVENMGGGHGWRVKDHDHVLHLFDTESDARNGKLVLSKYHRLCFLGTSGGDDPALVSYSL